MSLFDPFMKRVPRVERTSLIWTGCSYVKVFAVLDLGSSFFMEYWITLTSSAFLQLGV
ncbi:MAG: hypothetical protein QXJ97_10175 [Desulfurococcaceae archaeon]